MKAYKIELLIIDHDDIGGEEIVTVIEESNYSNRCIMPDVKTVKWIDIGDWYDDHPLNTNKSEIEYQRLFNQVPAK